MCLATPTLENSIMGNKHVQIGSKTVVFGIKDQHSMVSIARLNEYWNLHRTVPISLFPSYAKGWGLMIGNMLSWWTATFNIHIALLHSQLFARIERMERRMQLVKKDNEREKHKILQGYETEEKVESEVTEKLPIECQPPELLETSQPLPLKHFPYGRNGKGHKR